MICVRRQSKEGRIRVNDGGEGCEGGGGGGWGGEGGGAVVHLVKQLRHCLV